ncbi:MAG: hypothetical protein IJX65_06385 [Alistipes sp.]|nr:hypothetical protein [Alistipes sp.]
MIYSKVVTGDYYMILKGRVVDSEIAKHLSHKELSELRQKYEHYYNSMIVVLRHLEQDYNRYNCAVNPGIVVTAYGFPEIDNIIWYLKQTNQL